MTGFVDLHCHVLPGVDDGSPDLETSLAFLRMARDEGTEDIVATPHQHPGRYPNAPGRLRDALAFLLEARDVAEAAGETLPRVHLGAEVHLDVGLRALVEAGERLLLAGQPTLLLELPDVFPLAAVEEIVFELQLAGITPLLAHPERIGQLVRQPDQFRRLVDRGALGQATGSSIAGVFGEPCRSLTEAWIGEGLLHVVASDAHELWRRTPSLRGAEEALTRLFGAEVARAMLVDRPRALLEGRPVEINPPRPVAAPPFAPPVPWWRRLLDR